MTSVVRKYALVALCGTAIVAFSQSAQAASWSIVGGGALPAIEFPGYGPASGQDNVVNNPPSLIVDPTPGAPQKWNSGGNLNALFTTSYVVSWFYHGSESGDVIRFTAPGVVGFLEDNRNNNCVGCLPSPTIPPVLMGTALSQTDVAPKFNFFDTNTGSGSVTNGANVAAGSGLPNFILSYASIIGLNLVLQTAPSDWIVIGYNDNGGLDDNHDDFIAAAHITDRPGETGVTPIPGALPLLGSVLGGGFLFRKLRKRRQVKAQLALQV